MTHEQSKIRAIIIEKGHQFTKENIAYLEKNSNVTNDQAIFMISNLHIKSDLIRANFKSQVEKAIQKATINNN